MVHARKTTVHMPGLFHRLVERLRGREQLLVRAGTGFPLLLITYPSGKEWVARELETAYAHTLPGLRQDTLSLYANALAAAPTMVVVLLRPLNPCGCLGHHHPRGTESRLTRRLAADLGSSVGEIDLAYEGIRAWTPLPLSSLAAGDLGDKLDTLHWEAALLAVLLHELDHLAFPQKNEREIRTTSNQFYTATMQELVMRESGLRYGMAVPPPRP
jgi:hypothetical protein